MPWNFMIIYGPHYDLVEMYYCGKQKLAPVVLLQKFSKSYALLNRIA